MKEGFRISQRVNNRGEVTAVFWKIDEQTYVLQACNHLWVFKDYEIARAAFKQCGRWPRRTL